MTAEKLFGIIGAGFLGTACGFAFGTPYISIILGICAIFCAIESFHYRDR